MRSLFITAGRFCVYVLQLSELWGLEKITAVISFVLFKARLSGYLESAGPAGLPSKLGAEHSFFLCNISIKLLSTVFPRDLTRVSSPFVLNTQN